MRQYEFAIRIAQIHHLVEERKFKKALAVIRTLDMKQVKSISDLTIIADVFARTEQFDSARETYLKIYNKSKTRRVVYRLVTISIRTKELGDAEKYFQEFVQMHPGTRDAIILRYRIDKAAGVHIGKLIETLEELKEEEYIEEWAYELARLYYKAGRFEECRRECEDILLWFGHGEIVERAKKLIEYVDDKEAMPYLDDRDYTIDRNEPNPDDTGSLPDLHEYISGRQQKDDNRQQRDNSKHKRETEAAVTKELAGKQPGSNNDGKDNKNVQEQDGFIDDYEEDDFEIDAGIGKLAQKLTGFLHRGGKKDKKKDIEDTKEKDTDNSEDKYIVEESNKDNLDIKIRINKDLYNKTLAEAKNLEKAEEGNEIEEEKPQERKEKTSTVKEEADDNVNEDNNESTTVANENRQADKKPPEPVYFPTGMGTGITQDLSREISAIYEAEHGRKEQLQEKAVKVVGISGRRPLKRDATKVIERMTKAVKSDENKNLPSASTEEVPAKPEEKAVGGPEKKIPEPEEKAAENPEKEIPEPEEKTAEEPGKEILEPEEKTAGEPEENIVQEEEIIEPHGIVNTGTGELEDGNIVVSKEEIEMAELEAKKAHEEALIKAEEARAIVEEARRKAEEAARVLAEIERKHANNLHEGQALTTDTQEETNIEPEESIIEEDITETPVHEEIPKKEMTEKDILEEEILKEDIVPEEDLPEEMEEELEPEYEEEFLPEPVQEEEGLSDDDLPTTRALHTSFDDILTLIGGEPDPSHFVFVGNTFDLITGLSKRIVKVMKDTGYMSSGRIARISAKNLNKMNLAEFKNQLKGNCLLIDEAADLMIPTIASIFEIMDEYYGDFVVILADNGNTLDQLFKFAPALAKRFKYIIDISGYTEEDCK